MPRRRRERIVKASDRDVVRYLEEFQMQGFSDFPGVREELEATPKFQQFLRREWAKDHPRLATVLRWLGVWDV